MLTFIYVGMINMVFPKLAYASHQLAYGKHYISNLCYFCTMPITLGFITPKAFIFKSNFLYEQTPISHSNLLSGFI